MLHDPEKLRIGRERITRVFQYLKALNQHRNPAIRQIEEQPWHLWLRNLPDHPKIQIGVVDESQLNAMEAKTATSTTPAQTDDDFIIRVGRPKLTRAPHPPQIIADWLERGWEAPNGKVTVRESQNEVEDHSET